VKNKCARESRTERLSRTAPCVNAKDAALVRGGRRAHLDDRVVRRLWVVAKVGAVDAQADAIVGQLFQQTVEVERARTERIACARNKDEKGGIQRKTNCD
jgi:hypothetical protein